MSGVARFWVVAFVLFISVAQARDEMTKDVGAQKLKMKIEKLKEYAASQNASTHLAIFIDMSIPSWQKRFFVVDMRNDSVVLSGLCGHGQGKDFNAEEVVFSNEPGSLCSSEGRYRIGAKYTGQWGTSYRLYGLDASNSNAFSRAVVLHAHSKVPDKEDWHRPACRSYGCPMVSPSVFTRLTKIIDASDKPILMWVYK